MESLEDQDLPQKLSSGLDLVLGSRVVLEIGNVNMVEVVFFNVVVVAAV